MLFLTISSSQKFDSQKKRVLKELPLPSDFNVSFLYTPWKYQKTRHFLMFSHWLKMRWYCEGSWAQPGPKQRPVTTLNLEARGNEILKLRESNKGNIIVLQFKFQIWFCIFQICLWFCIKILFRTVLNYLIFPKSNSWQMGEFIIWKSSINSTFHNKSVKNALASRIGE